MRGSGSREKPGKGFGGGGRGDVLLRPNSPAPWSSGLGPSHPCAKCGTDTAGIAIGGLCAHCTRRLNRRGTQIARPVGIGTTAPPAGDVALAPPLEPTARLVGVASVLLWYVLTFLIAKRITLEWIK